MGTTMVGCSLIYAVNATDFAGGGQGSDAGPLDGSVDAPTNGPTSDSSITVDGGSSRYAAEVMKDGPVLYLRLNDTQLPAGAATPQVRDEVSGQLVGRRTG